MLSLGGDLAVSQSDYATTVPGGGLRGSVEYFFPASSANSFGLKLYAGKDLLYGMDKYKTPDYFRTNMFLFGFGGSYALTTNGIIFPFTSLGFSFLSFHTDGIGDKNKKYDAPDFNSLALDAEAGINIALSKSFLLKLSAAYHYLPVDLLDGVPSGMYNDFYITGSFGISYAIAFGGKYKKEEVPSPRQIPQPKDYPPAVASGNIESEQKPIQIRISSLDSLLSRVKKVEKLSDIKLKEDTVSGKPDVDLASGTSRLNTSAGKTNQVIDNEETGNRPAPPVKENINTRNKRNERNLPVDNKTALKETLPKMESRSKELPVKDHAVKDHAVKEPAAEAAARKEKSQKEFLLHGELTFVRDEATIQPDAYEKLDEIANMIKSSPGAKWKIEAYMDNNGSEKQLQDFSRKRALAVLKYLTKKGISPTQLKAEGKGSKDPIEDNNNVWGRMVNRRIVIRRVE
ncbi:MAG: OmpA family protein [Bacillota bacterium]